MDQTIIQQGHFTSTGVARNVVLRGDVDWMRVVNYTQAAAQNNGYGVEYFWQKSMPDGYGTMHYHPAADHTLAINNVALIFNKIDSTVLTPSAPIAVTAISGAAPGLVATGDTTGLFAGDIIRLTNVVGAQQMGGIDFTVGTIVANTTIELVNMPAIVAAGAAGANAYWRRVPYDKLFYPRSRYITAISQAASAVVTLSVTHGYTVGQTVRFSVPEVTAGVAYGMTEIDGMVGTITALGAAGASGSTNTITVNINTTGFTAFAFPLTADTPFTPAQIVPVGESASIIAGAIPLDDAVYNTGYIGMRLAGGTTGPAGNNDDVVYWVAGKSFTLT